MRPGTSTGLLFQCFAGDHRSSAALVAWLVFEHNVIAAEGIGLLLRSHPTLQSWHERPHWALKSWERKQLEIKAVVQSMVEDRIPPVTQQSMRCTFLSALNLTLPNEVTTQLNYLERFQHADGTAASHAPLPHSQPRSAWELTGESYRQKRKKKNKHVDPLKFQACWWIMAWS